MAARPTTLTPSREKALSANGGMSSSLWLETIILLVLSLMHKIHLFVSSFISFNVFISQSLHSDEILFFFISLSVLACCHSFVLLLLLLFYPTPLPPQPKADFHFHHDADMVKEKNYVEIWVLMALLVPLWLFTQHPEHKVRNKPSSRQWNHLSLPIHLVAQFDLMTLVRALSLALSVAKHISSSYRSIDVDLVSFLRLLSMLVFHSLRIVYDEWHDETHKSDFVTHSQSIHQDMSADKRPDR